MVLLRREIGDVLRSARQDQKRTLREVSGAARVSLGYLSEVERGQKEASSELLSSICEALEVPMSTVLRAVSDRVAAAEDIAVTLPAPALDGDGQRVDAPLVGSTDVAGGPSTPTAVLRPVRRGRSALVSAA